MKISRAVTGLVALAATTLFLPGATALPAAADAHAHGSNAKHKHPLIRADVARPQPSPPPRLRPVNGAVAAKPEDTRVLAPTKVALRPLVIALDNADFGLPTWKSVLDKVGTPYDVLLARSEPLTAARLTRPDGTGKYNAILLTDNALLYQNGSGDYVSAFDAAEWQALWTYESTYQVRQASLYMSWGTFPEDHCLRAGSEGGVETPPVQATLTSAGAQFFDYLKPTAQIPISYSYVYRSTLASGCDAQPLLMLGTDVAGVLSRSADGRERAGLTFSSNEYLMQTDLLGYGLLRWATRGVLVGEHRHWINADLDDWFNSSDHLYPDGHLETDPGFRLGGVEAASVNAQQVALRDQFPLAAGFTLNLPYNGGDLDPEAPSKCSALNTPDPLTSFSRCLAGSFRWVNHTVSHPEMNFTDLEENYEEIGENLEIGREAGLRVPTEVLKTPAYSGLGVYNPDPNAPDTDPPTDFGLAKSNRDMLEAAADLGVKYLHGNMSFNSHKPSCFNCGIYHPLEPSLLIVPDWPTNIGYQTTAPAEQTLFYNSLYGPNGRWPFHDHNLTYQEMLDYESDVALQHVMTGSAYAHTLHQGNLHQYAPGKSLTFDWLQATVAKYSAKYQVPLKNPDWMALSGYVKARTAHFAELAAKADPVWDKTANTVTYKPTRAGSLFLTGVTGGNGATDRYGTDNITQFTTVAARQITATATPRA
ncbi:hypothetical protein ALI144C_03025 [Actinosynnema sp. ALI-1.44]|uniref:Agd3-related carbohydrate-binding protein n=1 Tax=Actinosynnema sp. ALI-1.44 TaxID=1933779 RepID=UPI00097C04FE|nr:hypothetical protein [Actinosynnema sp. ALI-1.44]ONI90396.1 hypothetical protein ALI144C_03025 [Actinosynnema sp. ALI-1.44]